MNITCKSRKGSLSATNIAEYHHLDCDLFLHNIYNAPVHPSNGTTSPAESSKAQFERGNAWESKLFGWLDAEGLLLTVHSSPLESNDMKEIIDFDERNHFYVAGLTFYPPEDALATEFVKLGTAPVSFSLAKPDLLEIRRAQDGSVMWTVIDAKASKNVKTSHHAQIYFYTLSLQHHLPANFRSSGIAAVWLPPPGGNEMTQPSFHDLKAISVSLLSDSLKNVLFRRIPQILAVQREHVNWHYNHLCRDCSFNSDCRTRALREGKLGSMPNISPEEANNLRELLAISGGQLRPYSSELTDIEDLHRLISDQPRFDHLERRFPSTIKKAKRILGLSNRRAPYSALVEAARTSSIQVIHRRSFTCPKSEDIAIILSTIQRPGSLEIVAFCLSVFSTFPSFRPPEPIHGGREQLVTSLASVLRDILGLHNIYDRNPRTQCYIFSLSEQTALQRHLVDTALATSPSDSQAQANIQLCIGALSEGASLLSTSFQPLVLSGALLDFLGKTGQRSETELKMCLRRLGLPTEGTVEQLQVRIQAELDRVKGEGGRMAKDQCSMELGQLPCIVIVKREVGKLLALPIPGYWDLAECASTLLPVDSGCPSDEAVFILYKNGTAEQLGAILEKRNQCIYGVIQNLRTRVSSVSTGGPELLVNEARVLSANFMDICQEQHLRKLFFMQQFEVLTKLNDLWRSRIDGCPDAPILEYHSTELTATGAGVRSFNLISGILDPPTNNDRAFYNYLLVEDDDHDTIDGICNIPAEVLFDDLSVCGANFPLNRCTKEIWNTQHFHVQNKLLIAAVRDRQRTKVTLHTWGSSNVKLVKGRHYRLSQRLVDFNVAKVLSTLLELDFRCDVSLPANPTIQDIPFLQLIKNPDTLATNGVSEETLEIVKKETSIQRLFQQLQMLGSKAAGALVLKSSQRRAARRILSNRLAVIWGPPGTGKTHTLALSLLRLLDVQARMGKSGRQVVFITAMTHAAVQACLSKLSYLISCYREIESLPTTWLDNVSVEHVIKGSDHLGPKAPNPPAQSRHAYIYVGTVYQLFVFSKRFSFEVDCVIIDEAGQLALSFAALVLRSLSSTGRIIVAGDSEQLAPILSAQYPQTTTPIFGSILECLMSRRGSDNHRGNYSPLSSHVELSDTASEGTIVQLRENFRLNPDLSDFVSTIYGSPFRPQKVQARQLAARLRSITSKEIGNDVLDGVQLFLMGLSNVMLRQPQTLLRPPRYANADVPSYGITEAQSSNFEIRPYPISLALIRLQTHASRSELMSYEAHIRGEAAVAAALVRSIRQCCPEDDVFVATPHRVQRQAVKTALKLDEHGNFVQSIGLKNKLDDMVTVDTVERLQGSEAAFVICLFSLPNSSTSTPSTSELNFLLERRRLNVAISRTKTLCILITSDEVLRPSVRVLANAESAKGYSFLREFEDRAWSGTLQVDLDNYKFQ